MNPKPLIRLEHVTKTFGSVCALQAVSFELNPGEVHALVGENGAGKSTMIGIITGAHQPNQGRLEIQGHAYMGLSPARARELGIACIYQHPALFPDLTVAENMALRLGRVVRGVRPISWDKLAAEARALLSGIGADLAPAAPVRELSMAQQQLVEIACAVGAQARIVIMDEPTASLTQRDQQRLFEVVASLRAEGVGVIYVSHRLEEVFALANRITVLRDGHNVRTCAAGELDTPSLIALMVGRALPPTARSSSQSRPAQPCGGGAVLETRSLACRASGITDINLEIRSGEILGLAGLVGAGRTELARTLFGITPASSGQILLEGRPARVESPEQAVAAGIAYLPEDRTRHGIVLELPVAQNISLSVHSRLFPSRWLRPGAEQRLALDYIQRLDIRPAAPAHPASALSGGNQQKVALARWLATQPKVLILDEPTQGIDVAAKVEIHELIRDLAHQGMAILLISSDLPELLSLSDRVGVMRAGRLEAMLPGSSEPHAVMAAAFGHTTGPQ